MEYGVILTKDPEDLLPAAHSLFDAAVRAGEENADVQLPLHLHGFLVACLTEHLVDCSFLGRGFAVETEEASHLGRSYAVHELRLIGDGALLLTGLFPEMRHRYTVPRSHIEELGRAAYGDLSIRTGSALYNDVSSQFPRLRRVLEGSRIRPEDPNIELQLLNAPRWLHS